MLKSKLAHTIPMALMGSFTNQSNNDVLGNVDFGEHFKNRHNSHIAFIDDGGNQGGDQGGDQGGQQGGGDIDFNDPRIQDYVRNQVSEQTTGLKNKNNELLGKLQNANGQLEGFGGLTPEQAAQAQQLFNILNGSEEAQMIKDGRIDEVIAKRIDKKEAEWTETNNSLQEKLNAATESGNKYKGLYETKILEDSFREECIKAGALPEAVGDILMRARQDGFTLGEDGKPELRNAEGNLVYDDKNRIITPERYVESLRQSNPYYWPGSQGTGTTGQLGRQTQQNGMTKINDAASGQSFDLEAYRNARGGDKTKGRYGRNR